MQAMAPKSRHFSPAQHARGDSSHRPAIEQAEPSPDREWGALKAHLVKITRSRESAVAFLQRAGILDAKGRLTKPYRD